MELKLYNSLPVILQLVIFILVTMSLLTIWVGYVGSFLLSLGRPLCESNFELFRLYPGLCPGVSGFIAFLFATRVLMLIVQKYPSIIPGETEP